MPNAESPLSRVFQKWAWYQEEPLEFLDGIHLKSWVKILPTNNKKHLQSHKCAYDHYKVFSNSEVTTPKNVHDVTTPIEKLAIIFPHQFFHLYSRYV